MELSNTVTTNSLNLINLNYENKNVQTHLIERFLYRIGKSPRANLSVHGRVTGPVSYPVVDIRGGGLYRRSLNGIREQCISLYKL